MAMMIEQRAQLLQTLGSIATSAADAAAEGIAEAARSDSKTVDTALKLFGGFDRTEFENINGQEPNLLAPAVRPPASYEAPAEYFNPLSNLADQEFLVRSKDLLQQLEDPRFRVADGLSGFSDNRITQILMQNRLSMNTSGDVSLGGQDQDTAASLDAFGKLYTMENTVEKQLQLHKQLDIGAFGYLSPPMQNPRLERGFKGIPDVRIERQPNDEILNLWEHAMTAIPKTVGEFNQILDTLFFKTQGILDATEHPKTREALSGFCVQLQYLRAMFQNVPEQLAPNSAMLNYLAPLRATLQNLMATARFSG